MSRQSTSAIMRSRLTIFWQALPRFGYRLVRFNREYSPSIGRMITPYKMILDRQGFAPYMRVVRPHKYFCVYLFRHYLIPICTVYLMSPSLLRSIVEIGRASMLSRVYYTHFLQVILWRFLERMRERLILKLSDQPLLRATIINGDKTELLSR